MYTIFDKLENPYIYGPLTTKQVDDIALAKWVVQEDDGLYVGVNQEIQSLVSKLNTRPE